jgi:uncharacterized protein
MNKIEKLIPLVKPFYKSTDPAHDWAHVERVASNVLKLSEGQNVNTDHVMAAAYCHDIVNVPKDHPDRKNASSLSAKKAENLLLASGFSEEEVQIIQGAIIEHSYSNGLHPTSLEAAIVQDADRLDALGAIGILRCAAVNAQMKSNFYNTSDPLAQDRPLDDKSYMLDHYFVKLFKLPELMNTPAGKKMAQERIKLMESFVEELLKEIKN